MCFKKGNTELEDKFNAAIKELKEDGTFDKIIGYYIDGTEDKGYESPADADRSNGKLVMATNAAFEHMNIMRMTRSLVLMLISRRQLLTSLAWN